MSAWSASKPICSLLYPMSPIVLRIVRWMSSSAWVVTSPMTTHRPLVIAVSHATRACGSWASIPSSTASETWSHTLSGWPSVTDSDVSRNERDELKEVVTKGDDSQQGHPHLWGGASSPFMGRYRRRRGWGRHRRGLRPVVVPRVL